MPKPNRALLIAAILFVSIAAGAESPLSFLKPDSIDVAALLPDPPKDGSPEQQAEITLLLSLQQSRSSADVERGKAEEKFTVFTFADVMGPWFNKKDLPETNALFDKLTTESKAFSSVAKDHWKRPRPYAADPRVKPALNRDDDSSYPSGHATRGMLFALVLAEIDPADRAKILDRGQLIGFDRVIGGVHYPSDIEAGRTLGQAVFHSLMASDDFRKQLDAARQEFDHARAGATASR